jgi:tRNA(Ile)-lysidine synthase
MLDISRAEVVDYLRAQNLAWRIDASNADPRFARNRIRHQLLPALTRDWNPGLSAQLARTAQIARDEDEFLQTLVPPPLTDGHAVLIPAIPIDDTLRRRQVRWAIHHLGGKQLDFRHVEAIVALFAPRLGSGRLQAPGIDVMRSFDWVRFVPLVAAGSRNWSFPLAVPGEATLPTGQLATMEGDSIVYDASGAGLTVRNWRPGDAYSPAGTLKERFEAERIPLWERRNWPMITLGSEIVWAKRFGVADRFRVAAGGRGWSIQLNEHQLVPLPRPAAPVAPHRDGLG